MSVGVILVGTITGMVAAFYLWLIGASFVFMLGGYTLAGSMAVLLCAASVVVMSLNSPIHD